MRIYCIIHADFEKPGAVETWATQHGHAFSCVHPYRGEKLAEVSTFDLLVIMGGPQSPLALEEFPYIADEIDLTKRAIQANKAIIGFCLGAQIIAESLGTTTQRSPYKEVGSYPITLTAAAEQDPVFKTLPQSFEVMHWHNDMPGIPAGAELLASSAGCPQQAFSYADRIYGLQFHLEMTPALIAGMIENCPHDLSPGEYIRTEAELRKTNLEQMHQYLCQILDYLASCIK